MKGRSISVEQSWVGKEQRNFGEEQARVDERVVCNKLLIFGRILQILGKFRSEQQPQLFPESQCCTTD